MSDFPAGSNYDVKLPAYLERLSPSATRKVGPLPEEKAPAPARSSAGHAFQLSRIQSGKRAASSSKPQASRSGDPEAQAVEAAQKKAQAFAKAKGARAQAQAATHYQKAVEGLHRLRGGRPVQGEYEKNILAQPSDGKNRTLQVQAALNVLGKGHTLGRYGVNGIDGKRGFFTDQAVRAFREEYNAKRGPALPDAAAAEQKIIALARKRLAETSPAPTGPATVASNETREAKTLQTKVQTGFDVKLDLRNPKQLDQLEGYLTTLRDRGGAAAARDLGKMHSTGADLIAKGRALGVPAFNTKMALAYGWDVFHGKVPPKPETVDSLLGLLRQVRAQSNNPATV